MSLVLGLYIVGEVKLRHVHKGMQTARVVMMSATWTKPVEKGKKGKWASCKRIMLVMGKAIE